MKRILLLFFLFCLSVALFGQKQHNVWYFGNNAGVSFSTGAPVALAGGQTTAGEGVASICDTAGNILFYTDGITVWNRNNLVMPNGTGLLGNFSTTQSAIIVQQPDSANIYYIFTAPVEGSNNPVAYSIVDLTLSGGNGDITIKNSPLLTPASEKLTYVKHANGTDYWIICHEWNSSSFYSYLFSAAGVNTIPIISTTGIYQSGSVNNAIGYLKPSPCGDKLASAIWSMDSLEIFDFDKSTGIVSNGYTLSGFAATSGVYGVEFSPDGHYLYCSVITPGNVFQFDMNAGSLAAIAASETLVGTSAVNFNGALQTGPDGKIYMAKYGQTNLAVLNYPDSAGLLSGFVDNAVSLGTGIGQLGLPNYSADQFCSLGLPPVSQFASSDTTFCSESGKCIDFIDHSTGNPTGWHWLFPGAIPDSSFQQNPTNICYYTIGTYPVTLIVTNASGTDTLTVYPMITLANPPASPTTLVSGDTIFCSHAAAYQWYFNGSPIAGATDSFYVFTTVGDYSVQISDGDGCDILSGGIVITSVNELAVGNGQLAIYPNPVDEEFSVSGLPVGVSATLEVYNVLGEKVFTQLLTQPQTIYCKSFASGIYFIRVANEKINYIGKFVKE